MRLLLIPLLLLSGMAGASADTLKVLTAGAFKPVLVDLIPEFEKQSGHKVACWNPHTE